MTTHMDGTRNDKKICRNCVFMKTVAGEEGDIIYNCAASLPFWDKVLDNLIQSAFVDCEMGCRAFTAAVAGAYDETGAAGNAWRKHTGRPASPANPVKWPDTSGATHGGTPQNGSIYALPCGNK